jgi:hypothetical protein
MLSCTRSGIAVVTPHSIFLINQNVYRDGDDVEVNFLRELDDCQGRELAELLDIYWPIGCLFHLSKPSNSPTLFGISIWGRAAIDHQM